jgi:hypothetical protein
MSSSRSPKPGRRNYRPRIGHVMIDVATHLALVGASYPTSIARVIGARDGSTWKAVVRLGELGIIEEIPANAGPRNYRLTSHGWWELERVLIPRGGWTLGLATARMRALQEFKRPRPVVRTRSVPPADPIHTPPSPLISRAPLLVDHGAGAS